MRNDKSGPRRRRSSEAFFFTVSSGARSPRPAAPPVHRHRHGQNAPRENSGHVRRRRWIVDALQRLTNSAKRFWLGAASQAVRQDAATTPEEFC